MIYVRLFYLFILLNSCSAFAQGTLVWSDEFDYQGLPDPSKWSYEVGYIRNNERQYYKQASIENSFVQDGVLTLRALQHKVEDKLSWWDKFFSTEDDVLVTSASLTTKGSNSWKYGRFEMRAKLPQGKGVWPAFWTLGENVESVGWPRCGEIDIMEYVGRRHPNIINSSVHYLDETTGERASSPFRTPIANTDGFNIYRMDWDEKSIRFYVNNVYRHEFIPVSFLSGYDSFKLPHYLILNLAIGGEWAGEPDDKTFPAQFVIDYVRVYQ